MIIETIFILLAFILYSVINNIYWVDKGGEWYTDAEVKNRLGTWKGPVRDYNLHKLIAYVFMYRVFDVLNPKNYRDYLSSAIMTAVTIVAIVNGIYWAIGAYIFFIIFKITTLKIWKV